MPPTFIAPKRSMIEVEYGSSLNITCMANGMPQPRVKWLEGAITAYKCGVVYILFVIVVVVFV
jgi:hypothetical protein